MTLPNSKAPELSIVRDHIHEAATKLWFNYVESERKSSYRNPWEMHNQIQSVRISSIDPVTIVQYTLHPFQARPFCEIPRGRGERIRKEELNREKAIMCG